MSYTSLFLLKIKQKIHKYPYSSSSPRPRRRKQGSGALANGEEADDECRDAGEEYVLACWQTIRRRKKGMMDRTVGSDGSMVINPDGGEKGVAAEAVWRE